MEERRLRVGGGKKLGESERSGEAGQEEWEEWADAVWRRGGRKMVLVVWFVVRWGRWVWINGGVEWGLCGEEPEEGREPAGWC